MTKGLCVRTVNWHLHATDASLPVVRIDFDTPESHPSTVYDLIANVTHESLRIYETFRNNSFPWLWDKCHMQPSLSTEPKLGLGEPMTQCGVSHPSLRLQQRPPLYSTTSSCLTTFTDIFILVHNQSRIHYILQHVRDPYHDPGRDGPPCARPV